MDVFIIIIMVFVIFFLFSLCGWCCRRKREGAIFSSPVIITQQTYQPNVGPYPVSVQAPSMGGIQQPQPVHSGAYAMPHPGPGGYPMPQPAPPSAYSQPPYPIGASGLHAAPYPPAVQQAPNPPSYDQAISGEAYQKQSPYNPNYGGN